MFTNKIIKLHELNDNSSEKIWIRSSVFKTVLKKVYYNIRFQVVGENFVLKVRKTFYVRHKKIGTFFLSNITSVIVS